jgi:hypothetical protein
MELNEFGKKLTALYETITVPTSEFTAPLYPLMLCSI